MKISELFQGQRLGPTEEELLEKVAWFLKTAFPKRTREELYWYLWNATQRPKLNQFTRPSVQEFKDDLNLDRWIYKYFRLSRSKQSILSEDSKLHTFVVGTEVRAYNEFYESYNLKLPLNYKEQN